MKACSEVLVLIGESDMRERQKNVVRRVAQEIGGKVPVQVLCAMRGREGERVSAVTIEVLK